MALLEGIVILTVMAHVANSMGEDYHLDSDRVRSSTEEDYDMLSNWVFNSPYKDLREDTRARYYCGYKISEHYVMGRGGYNTSVFRLPRNESGGALGQPVLLQHNIFTNGDDWFKLRRHALPCRLSKAGYDVWVANGRGCEYSRLIAKKGPLGIMPVFLPWWWHFSFDDMAREDLPAIIDHILLVTKRNNVSFIGHVQGGSMGFVLLGSLPEYNKKVNVAVTLSPFVFPKAHWLLRWTSMSVFFLKWLLEKKLKFGPIGINILYDDIELLDLLLIILDIIHSIVPKSRIRPLRPTAVPTPRDEYIVLDMSSIRNFLNYHQMIVTEGFHGYYKSFPFRIEKNYYGQRLKYITTPQYMMYGSKDPYVTSESVREISKNLPKTTYRRVKEVKGYFREEFLFRGSAVQDVYDVVLRELGRHLPRPPPPPVSKECLAWR